MQNWLILIFQWWFGLFGITSQPNVALGITLFAVAIGLAVLWFAAIFIIGIIAALLGAK